MSDLETRVRELEYHKDDDNSGCGCLGFLVIVTLLLLMLTGHTYMIDNVVQTVFATPTPGITP